jgi:hypothetical protein
VRWTRLGKISDGNQNIAYGLKRRKTMAICKYFGFKTKNAVPQRLNK